MAMNEFSKGILGALSDVSRNQLQVGIAHVHRYIVTVPKTGQGIMPGTRWLATPSRWSTPARAWGWGSGVVKLVTESRWQAWPSWRSWPRAGLSDAAHGGAARASALIGCINEPVNSFD